MARRNLTIQLDDAVLRRAKVAAARHGTSVSALVAKQLEEWTEQEARYEEARQRALGWLRAPADHGPRAWRRDDLYDRPV